MLYLAVGDVEGWKRFSAKKPLKLQRLPVQGDGGIEIRSELVTWDVKQSCTISHVYIIDENDTIVSKEPLDGEQSLPKGGTCTIIYTLHHVAAIRPYLQ